MQILFDVFLDTVLVRILQGYRINRTEIDIDVDIDVSGCLLQELSLMIIEVKKSHSLLSQTGEPGKPVV